MARQQTVTVKGMQGEQPLWMVVDLYYQLLAAAVPLKAMMPKAVEAEAGAVELPKSETRRITLRLEAMAATQI